MGIIKLTPHVTDYIWGGTKLIEEYNIVTDKQRAAEAWVLSMHKDGESTVDGNALSKVVSAKQLGSACERFDFFPVLVKLIDARDNLSVQVHPSDEYALSHENSYGKTEMWYVLSAEKGAGLYVGFKSEVTSEQLKDSLLNGTILNLLNFFEVKSGDCFFIPAGTVHAIGAGCTICEVQQNSNLTYRLYDYNRVGADGNPRPLHIEKALEVTDLSAYKKPTNNHSKVLADCQYFTAEHIHEERVYNPDSFVNIVALENGTVDGKQVLKGESYFIPVGETCQVKGRFIKSYIK